jgi:DNA-binding response OmpR family regulator
MAKKILVIEDDMCTVNILERMLKTIGYEVTIALDGVCGLEKAQTETPDLITLDIELPRLNGFSICGLLKSHDKYKSIPIIICRGRAGDTDREFDPEVRPDAYLTKPFRMEELLKKIRELIGVHDN